MKDIHYSEYAQQVIDTLPKGAFLTTNYGDKTNTMTIGWGNIGVTWSKPTFTVLVRHSRYTYELIEKSGEFTVSVPTKDFTAALALCGTKSGRDMDKITAAGLKLAPGQKTGTPVIADCGIQYECKIVYKQKMDPAMLDASYQQRCYPNGDYHTLYFGEIVAAYINTAE